MRGYLRSPGHLYSLDADIISIGKGTNTELLPPVKLRNAGAHIPLSSGKAEPYHALLEKQNDNCFILTDLNTAYGTYVNEHRIQNGTIKLAHGDLIRFGHGGIPHEFSLETDKDNKTFNPYSSGRIPRPGSSSSSRRMIVESGSLETLGQRRSRPTSAQSAVSPLSPLRPDTAPTSTLRTMNSPLLKLIVEERAKSVPANVKMQGLELAEETKVEPTNYQQTENSFSHTNQEGWSLDGQELNDSCDRDTIFSKASSWGKERPPTEPWYVSMLREKEQRLLHMGDEISRLGVTEEENRRKDGVINDLRGRVAEMEATILSLKNDTKEAERERKLLEMGDEINRLSVFERECERKDLLVATLRDQVAKLEVEKQAISMDLDIVQQTNSTFLQQTNSTLLPGSVSSERSESIENQKEITEKLNENMRQVDLSLDQTQERLDEFRKQLHLPIPDRRDQQEIITELVMELEEKDELINQLKREAEASRHEKSISDGLIQALRRDVSRCEHKLTKVTSALEKAQRDSREATAKAQALSNKFANLKEEKKHEEILAMMEREVTEVHEKLQAAESKLSTQQEKLDKQNKDIRRTNRQNKQYLESNNLSQSQINELQTEVTELRQKELHAKVCYEQTMSRLERLRSRILQAVYTAPGAIKPETKLDDTEILSSIQKLITDRSDFHQQLCDLGQNVPPLIVTIESQTDDISESDTAASNSDRKMVKPVKKPAVKK